MINIRFFQNEGKLVTQYSGPAQSSYSSTEEGKQQKAIELTPLQSPQIIRSSPDEEIATSISPPPLKPNMAHKAW